ncbi:hypothetical protein KP509_36G055400 [Ceratopteris richardii]|uniref:Exocyst component Exo84 C-terminal domain-containing protein n=1 Tax=Ceratopteris richardii TaxID=49495 RepID=A0A8T2QDA5_CERRI|nr:hypothetical protein KP509_36G055400 [Ceratopteris richardii]
MEAVGRSVRSKPKPATDSTSSNHPDVDDLESGAMPGFKYIEPQYQSLTEKGIRLLCAELLELKMASAEEMRRNVFANYTGFIKTSQELSELELELTAMQKFINVHALLVRELFEGVQLQTLPNTINDNNSSQSREHKEDKDTDIDNQFHDLLDEFDVSLMELRIDDAVNLLSEVENMVIKVQNDEMDVTISAHFSSIYAEKKSRLVTHLLQISFATHGSEVHELVSHLNKLGEGAHAHTLLLKSYHSRIQNSVSSICPNCCWYAGAYVSNLAQTYFSIIRKASYDSIKLFGNAPGFASELIIWACKETEDYVMLVRKHIQSFSAAACGFNAVVDSVRISIGYCSLLEDQGLSLRSLILRLFKPCVEGALEKCLRRIEDVIMVCTSTDNWVPTEKALLPFSDPDFHDSYSYIKLSISAHKLLMMVQGLLNDATFMVSTQFVKSILDGIFNIFSFYNELLIKALPRLDGMEDPVLKDDGINVVCAENEAQQLVILGNVTALADELLPLSILKWQESLCNAPNNDIYEKAEIQLAEVKGWRKSLKRLVDEVRDTICEQHILELLFDEEEKPLLTADLYLCLQDEEASVWPLNPMPSFPFQALLRKLHGLEQRARNVLSGRERVIIMLFTRLIEAFSMWLIKDEFFWGILEDETKPLTRFGLHQFIFDMQFVVEIASAGQYASKKMHNTISTMVSRAKNIFLASDGATESGCQKVEWFSENAKLAMREIFDEMLNSEADNQGYQECSTDV